MMPRVKLDLIGYLCAAACATLPAYAQYPGHIDSEQQQNAGHLRATAVLEYTGDLKDPKANRLIPIAVWDGTQYQPGSLYLAEPAPLAVLSGTQYELEVAGQPKGFFDIRDAENIGGLWVGVGSYQAPPVVVRRPKSQHMPRVVQDVDPDKPHFAHRPADDSNADAGENAPAATAKNAPPVDPDRPTLHNRPSGSGSPDSSSSSGSGSAQAPAPNTDPDRPTLHAHHSSNSAPVSTASQPPVDPDRPLLLYGKPAEQEKIDKADALFGVPADMQQIAGISDARSTEHESYAYSWANPDDENTMKADLETIAAQAVAPPPPAARPTTTSTHTGTAAKRRKAALPVAPKLPALTDEEFHAYGLSFGGGATMVFSARTVDTPAKYVTVVAQPDFYGKPQILLKQVTSDNTLDVTPRMQLVDAVDTAGVGRADLLFELRGQTFRQFAIYRIAGGLATQAFVTQPTAN
jgi:hypothetical protein